MKDVTWVRCPCCQAEIPFPNDHPVHTRTQLELWTQEVLPIMRGQSREEILRSAHSEVHEEVYEEEEDSHTEAETDQGEEG